MPLENSRLTAWAKSIVQPSACAVVDFGAGFPPADFLDRAARDAATECLADELTPETMSDDRNASGICIANQGAQGIDPRQRIVDAHWPSHQAQAGEFASMRWNGFTLVDGDQLPWNRAVVEECGKIAWSLGFGVAENGYGFHMWTASERW